MQGGRRRRRSTVGKRRRPMRGRGFFDTLNNIAKSTGIVGKALSLVPTPYGQLGSTLAKSAGYGRRPRRRSATVKRRRPRVVRVRRTRKGLGGAGRIIMSV
jgi:hypothetical protein